MLAGPPSLAGTLSEALMGTLLRQCRVRHTAAARGKRPDIALAGGRPNVAIGQHERKAPVDGSFAGGVPMIAGAACPTGEPPQNARRMVGGSWQRWRSMSIVSGCQRRRRARNKSG